MAQVNGAEIQVALVGDEDRAEWMVLPTPRSWHLRTQIPSLVKQKSVDDKITFVAIGLVVASLIALAVIVTKK
jgi:hypothetical protein